jgi:site-specific DNA-methyltransferase (adenine-specific)
MKSQVRKEIEDYLSAHQTGVQSEVKATGEPPNETDIIEELRESYQKYGPVRPVIKTKFGIAAGETRKKAVEDWPEVFNDKIQTRYDHLRLKAADNIHKPKPAKWWVDTLTEAAEELMKEGVGPGQISMRLEKDFPLTARTIRRYLPEEYKDKTKVASAQVADTVSAEKAEKALTKLEPSAKLKTADDYRKAAEVLADKARKLLSPEEKVEAERKQEERKENARKAREAQEEKIRAKIETKIKAETKQELLSDPAFIEKAARLKATLKNKVDRPIPRPLVPFDSKPRLFQADISKIADMVEKDTIDAIITDPPYGKEYLPLYESLASVASTVLKPGGSLMVMIGQSYLPEVIAMLGHHLSYHWTIAYLTPGGQAVQLWAKNVETFWKPVLWFRKDGPMTDDWHGDVVKSDTNDNDKRFHEWGQSESGMANLVEKLTREGDLILDPFMGAGTTGVVALKLKRNFIGSDIDAEMVKVAQERMGVE